MATQAGCDITPTATGRPGIGKGDVVKDFGYRQFREPGEYIGQVEFRTAQGKVFSPPWKFTVLDELPEAVLASHSVPFVGPLAKLPDGEQSEHFVQQVEVASSVFLVVRRFAGPKYGGVVMSAYRITELPGKVEMTVEGVYEADKPLIIRYRASPTVTTTLTIHSVDGTIWDRSDRPAHVGDLRPDTQRKQTDDTPLPGKEPTPIAPAPKPLKP